MADDPKPPPPPIDPEIEALITKLATDLPNLPDNDEASRRFEWLLDLLIMRNQLPASFKRLAAKIQADRGTKIRLSLVTDKYDVESPPIDCASRLHLCGARCCSFEVALSPQDIAEKVVPFEVDRPYLLPRDPETKKCACMDRQGACTIYEQRPATCRTYDCREDARVWIDYEARIPAPLPASIRPTGYVDPLDKKTD
jgi:Fe-S-cluster containining protein